MKAHGDHGLRRGLAWGRKRFERYSERRSVESGLLAVLAVFTLTLASCGASPPVTMKVMPLGDSITQGWTYVPGGYRINLWKQLVDTDGLHIDFVGSQNDGPAELKDADHEGHVGWRIDELRSNIDSYLSTYEPDVVLLQIGTNDIFQGYDLAKAPDRLEDLVKRICVDRPGVLLSVASLTPLPDQEDLVDLYNAEVPGIVSRAQSSGCEASFVDMEAVVPSTDVEQGHPTRAGYDRMATAWNPIVTSMYTAFQEKARR